MKAEFTLHPLCTLFPRMEGAEFDALVTDIQANGQREPIVMHQGMVLDGGNRFRACIRAGVEPITVEFAGENIVSFVLSANLHRRHLSPGQQAAIVASAQDWAKAQTRGGDRKSDQSQAVDFDSVEKRSAASGVSRVTQMKADKVARADPELAKKVGLGEVSLPDAVAQVTGKPKKAAPIPKVEESLDDEGTDQDDIVEALLAENAQLKEENATLHIAVGTEKFKTVESLRHYVSVVETQNRELTDQNARLKREVKALRRRLGE